MFFFINAYTVNCPKRTNQYSRWGNILLIFYRRSLQHFRTISNICCCRYYMHSGTAYSRFKSSATCPHVQFVTIHSLLFSKHFENVRTQFRLLLKGIKMYFFHLVVVRHISIFVQWNVDNAKYSRYPVYIPIQY